MGRPVGGYRDAANKRLPGVTTVISRFKDAGGLIHWAWQCGTDGLDYRQKRDDAASLGHMAHELIEARIQGREPWLATDDPEMAKGAHKALEAFDTWSEMSRLEIIVTEETLVSEEHRVGGTLDGIGRVNGKLVLLDWKSSARIYPDYIVQVAAYRALWEEAHPDQPLEGIHLLRVGKEFGDFHHHSWGLEVMDIGWSAFKLMRQLYDLDKTLKRAVG